MVDTRLTQSRMRLQEQPKIKKSAVMNGFCLDYAQKLVCILRKLAAKESNSGPFSDKARHFFGQLTEQVGTISKYYSEENPRQECMDLIAHAESVLAEFH